MPSASVFSLLISYNLQRNTFDKKIYLSSTLSIDIYKSVAPPNGFTGPCRVPSPQVMAEELICPALVGQGPLVGFGCLVLHSYRFAKLSALKRIHLGLVKAMVCISRIVTHQWEHKYNHMVWCIVHWGPGLQLEHVETAASNTGSKSSCIAPGRPSAV